MQLTWRVAVLFAIGIVPLLFSGFVDWLGIAVVVYDGLIVALVLADHLLTPDAKATFSVERLVEEKLSLGIENKVVVIARLIADGRDPFGGNPRTLQVKDEPPADFEVVGNSSASLVLSATKRERVYSYQIKPPAKGDFEFGNTFIAYEGLFRLIRRVAQIDTTTRVMVYPNLVETEKYDMLARKGRLMQVGIRNARIRGGGSEFESLREYVSGDEYRKIDWSATARRGKLISRQYQAERSQNIMLVIDAGRAMLQPVEHMAKLDYVINTALMLAYVAGSSDDKVGLMVFDGEVRTFIPPAKGKTQVYQILNALYNVSAQMVESDYQKAFKELTTRWRRRSLVVLFTDLVDPDSSAEVLDAIPILERAHRTVAVTVSDPNITHAAKDVPETAAAAYRKAVSTQVIQERRQAISLLKRRGIWTIDSPPETLSSDLINHYLTLKARAGI